MPIISINNSTSISPSGHSLYPESASSKTSASAHLAEIAQSNDKQASQKRLSKRAVVPLTNDKISNKPCNHSISAQNISSDIRILTPYLPSQIKDTPYNGLDNQDIPTHLLQKIGIESESSDFIIISKQQLHKGDIIARTQGECFGYPILSITAEIGSGGKPCIELITAPLSVEQHKELKIEKLLETLKRSFGISKERFTSLDDILTIFNQQLTQFFNDENKKELLHIDINFNDSMLKKDGYNESCSDTGMNFKEGGVLDPGKFYIQNNVSPKAQPKWCTQSSFHLPYKNLANLDHFFGDPTKLHEYRKSSQYQDILPKIRVLDKVQSLHGTISKELLKSVDNDNAKAYLSAFLMHHSLIATTYHSRLVSKNILKNDHLNGVRHTFLSPRVSIHQELFEILDEQTIEVLNQLLEAHSGPEAISNLILEHVKKNHGAPPRGSVASKATKIYEKWLHGFWQDVADCIKLRKEHGAKKIHDKASGSPYILQDNGEKTSLPTHAADATNDIVESKYHYYFTLESHHFNNEPWVVTEFRPHGYQSTRPANYIPFNHNSRPVMKPTQLEIDGMTALWG